MKILCIKHEAVTGFLSMVCKDIVLYFIALNVLYVISEKGFYVIGAEGICSLAVGYCWHRRYKRIGDPLCSRVVSSQIYVNTGFTR